MYDNKEAICFKFCCQIWNDGISRQLFWILLMIKATITLLCQRQKMQSESIMARKALSIFAREIFVSMAIGSVCMAMSFYCPVTFILQTI